ncbi:MAG: glycosyltransferase family 4 protein [Ignavibacteria bacterium]
MTGNQKILIISVMQNWGGGEEFLLTLCKNVKDYDFIIASPEGKPFDIFRENKIKTYNINTLKKIYRRKEGWRLSSYLKIIFNIKISALRLLRLLKKENPSIILANGLFAAMYSLLLVFLARKRFIVVQHLIFDESSIEKRIVNLVYKHAEKIICVSKAVRDNVLLILKKDSSSKVIVIPNAIKIPVDTSNRRDSDQLNIGMIGSIIRIKGIHLVIEALKNILKNRNARLYLYGTTAGDADSVRYESELNKMINETDLNSKIFFKGYQDSKEIIYSSLDIVINYSLVPESFSFTVLESMAYKKIIICAEEGGPREIIKNGENGFLVSPKDVKLLERKIQFCIDSLHTEEFQKIRENAYLTVKNKYSIEVFVTNYINLFRNQPIL